MLWYICLIKRLQIKVSRMHTNEFYIHNHYGMIKTKIKKAIALAWIVALSATSLGSTFAATIGTGSVVGDAGFDSAVIWDDTFPGTATGTVSNILITAQVLPTLNMTLSTGSIDLGTLASGVPSNGSLNIEVGTNAANGVTITARSGSGGLTNTSDNTLKIQDNLGGSFDDGVDESYTFASAAGTIDSSITGFVTDGNLAATEVNDDTSEHTIYNTNKPEQDDGTNVDVVFTVEATSNAQTAAGNYQDNITFTVTGNF